MIANGILFKADFDMSKFEDNQILSMKINKSLNPKEHYFSYDYILLVDYKIGDYSIF